MEKIDYIVRRDFPRHDLDLKKRDFLLKILKGIRHYVDMCRIARRNKNHDEIIYFLMYEERTGKNCFSSTDLCSQCKIIHRSRGNMFGATISSGNYT